MDDFEIDDIVRFKLGGPLMLVAKIDDYDGIRCLWMTNSEEWQNEWFTDYQIVKVDKIKAAMEIKDVNEKFDFFMLGKD